MSTSSINNLFSQDISSVLSTALQTGSAASSGAKGVLGQRHDSSQLSPLAQLLEYAAAASTIGPGKIQTSYRADRHEPADRRADGPVKRQHHSRQFTSASSSGQLPNIQDLAKAIGGGHRHNFQAASGDADGDSSATSQSIQQLLAAFQASGSQSGQSLNPLSIIVNTLKTSGITGIHS
jgi:hypothetical protein